MPTKNPITLDQSIVKNRLVRGYSASKDLVGTVDSTTVGEYRKAIKHKGGEKNNTEVNTAKIPSEKNIRRDST